MPDVMNEWETIDYLIRNRCSISRYGDGELKYCHGRPTIAQEFNQELSKKLRDILKSNRKECLVGIPRFNRIIPTERKRLHWAQYSTKHYTDLYLPGKVYGSAFITRIDEIPEIGCVEYWDKVKSIWQDRPVIVLQGERKPFLKNPDIVEGATSLQVFFGPVTNAFSQYKKLMAAVLAASTLEHVIIIALGAAATAMAYDLSLQNRQALDLGHMGMFYARAHHSQTGEKDGY